MATKTYNQIKYLLADVSGSIEGMGDDSNVYRENLERLTNLIRSVGASKKQMNTLINIGQMCINDTDNADFMASYQDGEDLDEYVKSILKSLK